MNWEIEEKFEKQEERISQLENDIKSLLSGLNTHPLNNVFKIQYRKYFDKSKGDYVPNINEFIDDPPEYVSESDYYASNTAYEEYRFWRDFKAEYF
jgi:hypothetical protein